MHKNEFFDYLPIKEFLKIPDSTIQLYIYIIYVPMTYIPTIITVVRNVFIFYFLKTTLFIWHIRSVNWFHIFAKRIHVTNVFQHTYNIILSRVRVSIVIVKTFRLQSVVGIHLFILYNHITHLKSKMANDSNIL